MKHKSLLYGKKITDMKNIIIHPDATIKEAMEILDKTAKKVLLVVNEEDVLAGALTDGDIRRYILKKQNLTDTIENAFNKKPVFILKTDFNQDNAKKIFLEKKIDLIPILDQNKKVVDYVTWEKVFGNGRKSEGQRLDIPVVIMAGGNGTRLKPFTKVLPKPLIPIDDKPVIDHIIDRFRAYGATDFFMMIHHMPKIIRAYFEEKEPEYSIKFAEEDEPRGTAGSLLLLKEKLNGSFFVSNCDIIIQADYSDILFFHQKNSYDFTLVASAKQFNIPYGVCELSANGNLECIKEKPRYDFLVNTGLYILNSNLINLIPDKGVFHMTNLIEKVRENRGAIGVYPISENAWIDIGQWDEYRKALKVMEGI